jgi:hypothetical protein
MYLHIIDRSDLSEMVGDQTRLESLKDFPIQRTDIVLINGTVSRREYSLHVTSELDIDNGFAGDLWILDILTDRDYAKVQAIAHRMRANAKKYPEADALLVEVYRSRRSDRSILPFSDR